MSLDMQPLPRAGARIGVEVRGIKCAGASFLSGDDSSPTDTSLRALSYYYYGNLLLVIFVETSYKYSL